MLGKLESQAAGGHFEQILEEEKQMDMIDENDHGKLQPKMLREEASFSQESF